VIQSTARPLPGGLLVAFLLSGLLASGAAMTPNPSLHRTRYGRLRRPARAGEL
jgi:hypothetical protein